MPVNLHPHQQVAVDKMHNGCVLYGGVGVGKSITAMAYFVSKICGGEYGKPGTMATPRDIYVITTAKKRDSLDWEVEAARFGILTDTRKSMENIKITVDSWNNIKDYVDVTDAFFIFDEQRVVGYGAWSRAFIKIARSNPFVLLSATPGDTWLDYIPLFIANGWYRNKTDFLDQHVIWTPRVKYPKVLRYQNVAKLVKHRNDVLVHMPYERHTIRHPVDVKVDYDKDAFDKVVKKRWHVYESRPLRDASELFSVMRKVVNTDSSRLRAVLEIMEKHPKLIVFYNFDYELELLRTLTSHMPSGSETTTPGPSENPSERSSHPGSPKTGSSSYSSSPRTRTDRLESVCNPTTCEGHWTKDRGNGETFLTCPEFRSALMSSSASSKASSTTGSSTGRLLGSAQTGSGSLSSLETGDTLATSELLKPASSVTPAAVTPEQSSATSAGSFAVAEWNGHKHEEIPATERWLYLVQYRAGAEGWNCVETDAMVFFSQTYSYRDWWQAHGRIDRLNTLFTNLHYYHLISDAVIDKAIRRALKAKKNFNERDLAV